MRTRRAIQRNSAQLRHHSARFRRDDSDAAPSSFPVSYFAAWLGVISAMIAVLEEGGIDRSAVMAKVADAKTLLAEEIATEFL